MNTKSLLLVASLALVFKAATAWPQTLILTNAHNLNFSQEPVQHSSVLIQARDLEQPHFLTVTIPNGSIEGKIELNEKFLSDLQNQDNRIDLAPHLLRGNNIIKILGNYNPERAAITVKLSGPHTQVVQQASGNGKLNHTINLVVK